MNSIISVIVPVYNVETYLGQCIESLINQSYKNLEIILIDDGSPDNCGQICENYAKKDSRIKVIHQENQGLSGARNTGLEYATGDFISFVDSDDWIGLEMYKVMLKLLLDYNLDVIECNANRTKSNKEIEYDLSKSNLSIENSLQALKRIIRNSCFSVWRRLYRKEIIKGSKFLLNKTSEDIYFTIDNIQNVNRLGYINIPFYNYRLNNLNSITKSGYSLKRLTDSVGGSLYLQNELENIEDYELQEIIKNHMLIKLLLHYKLLNYNSRLDIDFKNRRYLKSLIKSNYNKNSTDNWEIKLARYLPIKVFHTFIKLNKFKHQIITTKSNTF